MWSPVLCEVRTPNGPSLDQVEGFALRITGEAFSMAIN